MDNRIWFGKVHIVEWLRPDDRRTGQDLFNELEPIGIMSRPEIPVDLSCVSTRAEFIQLLRTFEEDLRTSGRLPALHIETHGSNEGIGVSATEGFSFHELMEELIPLNMLSRLNLFVVLAACEGIWGIKMLQPLRRAAFRALIGPNREMFPDELARASIAFYRTLFRDRSADTAFKAMNDAVDVTKATFSRVSAEIAFKWVYAGYRKDLCTPGKISMRVEKVVKQFVARELAQRGLGTSHEEMVRARTLVRQHMEDHELHFETMREDYFLIDLCPENDARFDVKIADCRPEP
jgi:hypothetical protein